MKILVCDDHTIFREGIKRVLTQLSSITLFAEARDGNEALSLLKNQKFDVVLLDISMPGKSGLEILEIIKQKWPATHVLMCSMHPQDQYAIRVLKMGAAGYLNKNLEPEELLAAIKNVYRTGKYIQPSLGEGLTEKMENNALRHKHETLGNREFEIMIHLANGITMEEIGKELFISYATVSTYRWRIMRKMGFKSNTELTRYCLQYNLI